MPEISYILLVAAALFICSIVASKLSTRLGVPALLLFALVGMLAGSDGPGGIYFDHPWATQFVGVMALSLILFSAGFETPIESIRPVLWRGLSLATLGVVCSAVLVAACSVWVLHFSLKEGLLLGAIVSSTDAAAVFNVLRSKALKLKGSLGELIEFESGSNDPMAVLLTIAAIRLITAPEASIADMAGMLVLQLAIGAASGYVFGKAIVFTINRIRLEWEGLYPVLSFTLAMFTYGAVTAIHGNGFLGVYIAGIVVGQANLIHRTTLRLFHDGLAWLMQIAMFLVLGLQVFPSHLPRIAGAGLAIAFFLMVVARPVSVFLSTAATALSVREKLLISWAGLRGAAPVVLATFPLVARIPRSDTIFNVVFFVALTSLLLQGTTLPTVARWLRLQVPAKAKPVFPLLFNPATTNEGRMVEVQIAPGAYADGKRVMDLHLPAGVLLVLLNREKQFVVPQGGTILRSGDTMMVLADSGAAEDSLRLFQQKRET